ncbi:MAG TPA: hypothetical protein DEG43_01230 [Acidimicrobiaceae bacterium]|nr:hypothetical protein [Acidimicrobiaceae bacterium]
MVDVVVAGTVAGGARGSVVGAVGGVAVVVGRIVVVGALVVVVRRRRSPPLDIDTWSASLLETSVAQAESNTVVASITARLRRLVSFEARYDPPDVGVKWPMATIRRRDTGFLRIIP